MDYRVELDFWWGRITSHCDTVIFYMYDETDKSVIRNSKKKIEEKIVKFCRNLTFDCDHLDMPLNPYLGSVRFVPIGHAIYLEDKEYFTNFMENEKKWVEELIKSEKLYINGDYNYELSPLNKE